MAVLRVQHCGLGERHPEHNGSWTHHLAGPGPHLVCNGDPDTLARQRDREANPPPGPPAPPQRIEWEPIGRAAVFADRLARLLGEIAEYENTHPDDAPCLRGQHVEIDGRQVAIGLHE